MRALFNVKTVHQLFKFGLATGLSACFTLGLPFLLHEKFGIDEQKAVGFSLTLAFVVNFFVSRFFVFKSKGSKKKEITLFTLTSLFFRGFEFAVFSALHEVLGIWYMEALVIVLWVSLILKFLVYKFVVFKPLAEELGAL